MVMNKNLSTISSFPFIKVYENTLSTTRAVGSCVLVVSHKDSWRTIIQQNPSPHTWLYP